MLPVPIGGPGGDRAGRMVAVAVAVAIAVAMVVPAAVS
jgi:hypothetical protein